MKELVKIIESLHDINQQVIEKDNIINNYTDLINLFSQLISDPDFVKSDIYLDLRLKYIAKIEEKLKNISGSNVVIEPENLTETTKTTDPNASKKKFTAAQVKAPISTDIYVAPNSRKQFVKKKITEQSAKKRKNNVNVQIEDDNDSGGPEYISFTHEQNDYYINTTPLFPDSSVKEYNIYDRHLQIAGNLKGPVLTLLNDDDLSKSTVIHLMSISPTQLPYENEKLLGMYAII